MKVNVVNKIGEKVDVVVTEEKEDVVTITVDKKPERVRLGDLKPGDVFRGKLNCDEYICLGKEESGIAVITKGVVPDLQMEFGRDVLWINSNVRQFLEKNNSLFHVEFGSSNFKKHITRMNALDGSFPLGVQADVVDEVGLLSLDMYRKYSYILAPIVDGSWWLSTARSNRNNFKDYVLYVNKDGLIFDTRPHYKFHIRPFFCLDPETMVIPVVE